MSIDDKNIHDQDLLLEDEARAFDEQILERVDNGHIPDLRRSGRCEWFYNNPWRDQLYADMIFGKIVRDVLEAGEKYLTGKKLRILEVACGPGHITLELSRNGHDVDGLDISPESINVARRFADEDPDKEGRGELQYHCMDFFKFTSNEPYDVVVFAGSLHHFGDTKKALTKVNELLHKDGLVYASEPMRGVFTESDAAIIHLVRTLLSLSGHYFQELEVPDSRSSLDQSLNKIIDEFDYITDSGEKVQSPMDNEATFSEMYPALKSCFDELEMKKDSMFLSRMLGGIRFEDIKEEHRVAKWLSYIDNILCSRKDGFAEKFHFLGKKNSKR